MGGEEKTQVEEGRGVRGVEDDDRYRRGGVDMLQPAAFESIDLHKSMENSHRGEE